MRKGICKQYGKCQLAKESVVQEIVDDFDPFKCRECNHILDEISNTTDRKPLPKWFIPVIGLAFVIIAFVTFILIPPHVKKATDPILTVKQQKVFFTNIVRDTVIYVQNDESKVFNDAIGPLIPNISVDTIYWEVKKHSLGLKVNPDRGFGKTIVTKYYYPENDSGGTITLIAYAIKDGQKGVEMEFNRSLKIQPAKVMAQIQLSRTSGSKILIRSGQLDVEIPKQILTTTPPDPDIIHWRIDKSKSYKGLTFINLPDSGSGDIPGFRINLSEVPASGKIVFDIEPIKKGFKSVKGTFVIPLSGNACASPESILAFNNASLQIIGDFEDLLHMISKTGDPVLKAKFIKDANTEIQKINGITVKVDGFKNLSEYLNSGFTNRPAIKQEKNECNMIIGITIRPN